MARRRIASAEPARVTVGVDTHRDLHVARAKDQLGRPLGEKVIPTTPAGYRQLLAWAKGLGELEAFGVEGSGSYGAGLSRYLRSHGQVVVEVLRPNRQARRRNGKSDPADADAAASAVLSGEANGVPKTGDAAVEMVRCLRIARTSAMKARTQAINAIKALVVTAPPTMREALRGLRTAKLVDACSHFKQGELADPEAAVKAALRVLARRVVALEGEAEGLQGQIDGLVATCAPKLLQRFGVGPDSAAALLLTAGDNPERLRSEAAFSMLCGSSPVEASSGKVVRHRLNRGGDRQANAALYRIVISRMHYDARTKAYVDRRTKEGKSKAEIIRCLKRYVAREIYGVLRQMGSTQQAAAA